MVLQLLDVRLVGVKFDKGHKNKGLQDFNVCGGLLSCSPSYLVGFGLCENQTCVIKPYSSHILFW